MVSGPRSLLVESGLLEGGGDRQAEGFTRFTEGVLRAVTLDGLAEGVIARAADGEHITSDQLRIAALNILPLSQCSLASHRAAAGCRRSRCGKGR